MMLLSRIQYYTGVCLFLILLVGCTKTEPSAFQKDSFFKFFGRAYLNQAIDIIKDNENYYILGNVEDGNGKTQIFLTKTDEYGNRVWLADLTYSINNKQTLAGQIIKLEKQPGFAIIGSIELDTDSLYFDTYLLIIDEKGAILTDTIYNNAAFNDYGKCIGELQDGSFTISTLSVPETGNGSYISLITASSTGEVIRKSSPYAASELFQICNKNDNNGFYVAAYSTKPFIILINTDGTSGGTMIFDNINGQIKSIAQDVNGNTFICGKLNNGSNGGSDGFIAKLTNVEETFTFDWLKEYGNSGIDYLENLVITQNDEILLAGSTENPGLDTYDIWVLKTDIAGNILSQTIIGGDDNEFGIHILESDNNKYIVEGTTYLEKNSMISIFKSELK